MEVNTNPRFTLILLNQGNAFPLIEIIQHSGKDNNIFVQNLLQYATTVKKQLNMAPTSTIGNQNHHQKLWEASCGDITIYSNAGWGNG